jgi:hypothetical protein
MRCLTSEDDIISLTGIVQVHVIKSKDRFQSAFCFIASTSKRKCILQYTTASPKGPVACFTPRVSDGEIKWETTGVVKIFEHYRENDWCDSTYCMDIGQEEFYRYQQWLIPWLKKNKVYSVFEGDSTARTFLIDSFNYFCKTLTDRVQLRAPLFLPEVDTYVITFASREKVSAVGTSDVVDWYRTFSYDEKSIYQAIDAINAQEYIYLRDVESGRSRYYLVSAPRIKIVTEKIPTPLTLLPAMIEDNPRLPRGRRYNNSDQATSRSTSSSEDTIVLPDTRSFGSDSIKIPLRTRSQLENYSEEDTRRYKRRSRKHQGYPRFDPETILPPAPELSLGGIRLAAAPCANPSGIAGVCLPPEPLEPSNANIGVIIVLVTFLIFFIIIIFVTLYIYSEVSTPPGYPGPPPGYPGPPPGYPGPPPGYLS